MANFLKTIELTSSIYSIMDFPLFSDNISQQDLFLNTTNLYSTNIYEQTTMDHRNTNTNDYLEWSNDLKMALNTVKLNDNDDTNSCLIDNNFTTLYNDGNDAKLRLKTRKRKALFMCSGSSSSTNTDDDNDDVERKIQFDNNTEQLATGDNKIVTCNSIGGNSTNIKNKKIDDNTRISTWPMNDISENLSNDLDGSLSELGADLTNGSYNMGETLLQLPSLQVFKQEAPSPTNNQSENSLNGQRIRQQTQQQMQSSSPPSSTTTVQTTECANNTTDQRIIDTNNNPNASLQTLLNNYNTNIVGNSQLITGNSSNQHLDNNSANYGVTSSTNNYIDNSGFQYVLAAATSIATKINEDTLTYLNQGQSYEIKLKKLGDLSSFKGKTLKSVIGICFHERRMQYGGRERLSQWQNGRPGDRVLEVDVPLSYGLTSLQQPSLNTVVFNWDPTAPVGVYIKVNCISTEFTEKKHGGERGIPLRIQVETYDTSKTGPIVGFGKRLHAGACQIKVFKLKGADRKHKQDREKIMKRPLSEQEKYQPSYDCTVLNDISYDDIIPSLSDEPSISNQQAIMPLQNGGRNNYITNNLIPQSYVKGEESQITTATNLTIQQQQQQSQSSASCTQNQTILDTVDNKPQSITINNSRFGTNFSLHHLSTDSTSNETSEWLTTNRFSAYLRTFNNFSGADILRLSRDDLIQICGLADGIRLYNALHAKIVSPKLTLYVSTEQSNVFNAVYLSTYSICELSDKLSRLIIQTSRDQVQGYYIQGPNGIHIHINDEVVRHLKNETMYSMELINDITTCQCRILLKPFNCN